MFLKHLILFTVVLSVLAEAFLLPYYGNCAASRCLVKLRMSDWGSFSALDDDDDLLDTNIDTREYAVENDPDEVKAQVGATLDPPEIDDPPTDPIQVPAGSQLELSEDTVLGVLQAAREELGTLFGYTAENRGRYILKRQMMGLFTLSRSIHSKLFGIAGVGITGGVDFVEMDGPIVVIRLKGRFWHQRTTVLDRVANYLQQRIPEIVDVDVEDPYQLTDEANEVA